MYQFIRNLLPSREKEIKKQDALEDISSTVNEAKQEVSSVNDIEFDLSLAIKKTSNQIDDLEKKRNDLQNRMQLMEKVLKDMSYQQLNEVQLSKKKALEKQLNGVVKNSLDGLEFEIDQLTRKLLLLNEKRDYITQRMVITQSGIDDAVTLPTTGSAIDQDQVLAGNISSSSSSKKYNDEDDNGGIGADQSKTKDMTLDIDTEKEKERQRTDSKAALTGDNNV
ncbi:hypothetical protein SAMD00019534_002020 [Acytostelium subglobosum LB1]|uniref:hypothetical protein n=1 Tax=Acytostelium subglobosum LB1 TaxID=1410327 RepID=UPI000644D0D1|nr:hypothetical protein SAMD00019534_002020 [Acytostelium subglobosum LB1]GAM17027.1 hypothetical protein SAMD00019534_002020 [Acytostelium subglobosum LB1]|eukprot:XP_012759089.1 hypothetical protein SAMD00019534_002020 [Acytostelium subglobosum LB1]